jgi:[acyl-carrier-protein] S-malonyltransferase
MQEKGLANPAVVAGHSLGEYSALVAAGAIQFSDAVNLVAERGRLMQAAVPAGQGGMAAILGLDDASVINVCESAAQGDVLSAVNFNAPGQVVVAGSAAAVERVVEAAKEAGAKRALPLPVSLPSHCALMKPAADKLAEQLAAITISAPTIPVINNVDVTMVSDADAIRDALVRQLYSPVRWVESVQKMVQDGVDTLVECGPGKVLVGLNKRIEKSMNAMAVFDTASLDKAVSELSA